MLNHEEMIENVHRRIAQYEEEKNMKHSKLKNMFSAKNADNKNDINKNTEEEYIDVVSGTDNISFSNNRLRIVSTWAVAVVLVTGIGATGIMLHKNNANIPDISDTSELSEVDVSYTESTEPTNAANSDAVAPFADFKKIYFSLYSLNGTDNAEYSDETYEKLAVFLNTFNWGKENDIAQEDIPDFDEYSGNGYDICWKSGDLYFNTYITENGKAYYIKTQCTPNGGCFDYPVLESLVFDIDYKAFDKGINDILSSNIADADEYLSQREIMYLTQGEFQNGRVELCEENDLKEVIPQNHKSFNALLGFLSNDFVNMLQKDKSVDYDINDHIYTVVCDYKTSDTVTRELTYYISSNGAANLCEYDLTENGAAPTGCSIYYIDIAEFEIVLNDILNGMYDDKYSFDINTAATTETTITTTETTETTETTDSEQTDVHEEETEEKVYEDEEIVREFYLSENNGYDGSIEGSYRAMDENGIFIDYGNKIKFMLYRADILPFDRVLGPIVDEEDAISKGREILLKLWGQEYIDRQEREYIECSNGIKIYRDNPFYIANYHEDYDIWVFSPTLFSSKSEDGESVVCSVGTVPYFYIRGCDGKILACWC